MPAATWYRRIASPTIAGHVLFALVAFYSIFYLPYLFPPALRLSSDSYVFGFNNSVAVMSIVVLLAFASLVRFFQQRRPKQRNQISFSHGAFESTNRIPCSTYWMIALLYFLFTIFIFWMAQNARFYNIEWESSYFLWRLKLMEIYGLQPYTDFHFEYGPALIYLPAYFYQTVSVWPVSQEASYYAFHYLVNLLSLYCIFFLLGRSLMPLGYKKIAFWILGLASFAPYMGLNGIAARFLLPYVSLAIVHQEMTRAWEGVLWMRLLRIFISVFIASVVNILISVEIAIAFSIALIAYSMLAFRNDFPAPGTSLFAWASAFVLCGWLLPKPYYESLLSFSKGANNFPLLPAAHLLLYIVTLFIAIPWLIAAGIQSNNKGNHSLFGFGVLSIVLIPGAFGRCDPPHVFFYGLGISTITFTLLANSGKKRFLLYSFAYVLIFLIGFQWSNSRVFGITFDRVLSKSFVLRAVSKLGFDAERKKNAVRDAAMGKHNEGAGTLSHFQALDKYPQLGLPFANYGTDKKTEKYLWSRKKIAPEYYMGAVGVYTEADLARKLQDVDRHEYLLLLEKYWRFHENQNTCGERLQYIRRSFIYPISLPCKQKPLDMHIEISRHIESSYQIVETIGEYVIMKRFN